MRWSPRPCPTHVSGVFACSRLFRKSCRYSRWHSLRSLYMDTQSIENVFSHASCVMSHHLHTFSHVYVIHDLSPLWTCRSMKAKAKMSIKKKPAKKTTKQMRKLFQIQHKRVYCVRLEFLNVAIVRAQVQTRIFAMSHVCPKREEKGAACLPCRMRVPNSNRPFDRTVFHAPRPNKLDICTSRT